MNKLEYSKYLESDHWKKRRAAWRSQDRNKACWICGETLNLNVHHRRYERSGESVLYKEKDSHLSTLCRDCHFTWHKHFPIYRIFKRNMVFRILGLMEVFKFSKDESFKIAADFTLFSEYAETLKVWKKEHWLEVSEPFKKPPKVSKRPHLD